jgi:hypothetical protein
MEVVAGANDLFLAMPIPESIELTPSEPALEVVEGKNDLLPGKSIPHSIELIPYGPTRNLSKGISNWYISASEIQLLGLRLKQLVLRYSTSVMKNPNDPAELLRLVNEFIGVSYNLIRFDEDTSLDKQQWPKQLSQYYFYIAEKSFSRARGGK